MKAKKWTILNLRPLIQVLRILAKPIVQFQLTRPWAIVFFNYYESQSFFYLKVVWKLEILE